VAEPPEELMRGWRRSQEEEADDVQVYRPSGWDFPPARGRRGLEFRPGGDLLVSGPGRGDAPEAEPGRWEAAGEGRIKLMLPAGGEQELELVSVEPDRLTVRALEP
jgi:hypothetical protein